MLDEDGEPIINTEKQRSVHAEDYDAEIFDDGDFYQMLLKELIESGMNDVQGTPIYHRITPLHFDAVLSGSRKKIIFRYTTDPRLVWR